MFNIPRVSFETFRFAEPLYLWLLLVPAVVLLIGVMAEQIKTIGQGDDKAIGPRRTSTGLSSKNFRSPRVPGPYGRFVLLGAACGVLVICLLFTHSRSGAIAALLAGFVARVGSEVFDASAAQAIERFRTEAKEKAGT